MKTKIYHKNSSKTLLLIAFLLCISTFTNAQEFNEFKQDIEAFVIAIKQQQYYQLRGEMAVAEAEDDLSNYISWWKGAQWEYTLATKASTLDLLKRAWLEQYLAQHDLSQLLKYGSIE